MVKIYLLGLNSATPIMAVACFAKMTKELFFIKIGTHLNKILKIED